MKRILWCATVVLLGAISAQAEPDAVVSMKVSGEGAVDDSTIRAGKPVSVDVYLTNDTLRTAFSLGFKFSSNSIKKLIHPEADSSATGLIESNKRGDVRGYNGWNDKSVWDFGGVYVVEKDWDGAMPELLGFAGISVKMGMQPVKEPTHYLSINMVVPDTGRLVIDSTYYPPGGDWLMTPSLKPTWKGPYSFKVVK